MFCRSINIVLADYKEFPMENMAFQTQLLSVMEVLAAAAVEEIQRRVEESCAGLRSELSRSRRDIESLKRKCVLMDGELRRVRRRRVWICGTSDRFSAPLKNNRDQEQTPDQTLSIQQSVCLLENEIRAPEIKQEQEQEPAGTEQQIPSEHNTEIPNADFDASEIQNTLYAHTQTSAEPVKHDEEEEEECVELQVKAEEENHQHWTFEQPIDVQLENTPAEQPLQHEENTHTQSDDHTQMEFNAAERDEVSMCGASASVRRLRTHWRSSVDVEKRYSCTFCRKNFSRFSQLKEHLRSHTGEKPFTCAQCGRSFTKHCNLIRHAVVHSGEKPYQCTQCGKRFTQRSSLKSHQRMHTDAWENR